MQGPTRSSACSSEVRLIDRYMDGYGGWFRVIGRDGAGWSGMGWEGIREEGRRKKERVGLCCVYSMHVCVR